MALRRAVVWRCLGARSNSVVVPESRVTAWYSGSKVNLDRLEYRLRLAHWPHARVSAASGHHGTAATNTTAPSADAAGNAAVVSPHRNADAIVFSVTKDPKLVLTDATLSALASQAHHRKTFVVMAEGAIVGWNGAFTDLVSVWGLAGGAPSSADGAGADKKSLDVPPNTVTESVKFAVAGEDQRATYDPEDAVLLNRIDSDTDTFVIADHNDVHKLSLSYALAQSVKMDVVDLALAPVQQKLKAWQKHLALTGALTCSVRDLRQTKTQLLTLFETLNFTHSAQTTPRIFFSARYQRHRSVYKEAREHLEIDDRYEQLQGKITSIDEALSFLSDEVHTSTNELLTWVIIWLIVVEIILAMNVHHWLLRVLWPPPAAVDAATSTDTTATESGAAAAPAKPPATG